MTTLLVDGNNLLARADFAAKGHHVEMSSHGVNTAALHIFIQMISKYLRMTSPDRVRVCWDGGYDRRTEAYPEYKGNRRKTPEERHEALEDPTRPFAQAKEFLTWAGISHVLCRGWEADDLIAVAARQALDDVVILSGDKDLLQLVRDEVVSLCSGFGGKRGTEHAITQIRPPDDELWDEDRVEAKFGVYAHHLSQYLALVGDTSDGVPGLRGIGPKRAVAMIEAASGDWETLLGSLDEEKAAEAVLMRSLVDLREIEYPAPLWAAYGTVPDWVPITPDSMTWGPLEEFCHRYELATVLERLVDGTLWADPVKPSSEGVFDDLDTDPNTPQDVLDPVPEQA